MAFTQNQQYLADIAQAGDADQCCLALGGDLVIDADGTPLCSFEDFEYPRSQACGYAANVGTGSATPGGAASGGGIGNWFANNLGALTDSASTIIRVFNPTPPPATPPSAPAVETNQVTTKQIITAILVLAGFVAIIMFIRRKK